jgi:protein TonB
MAPKQLFLSFISTIRNSDQNRRLSVSFTVSIVAHVLVLLVQFTMPERGLVHMPNLDVILVNTRHDTAPKTPQALAQANLDGGGDSSEKVRATSPLMPQESLREGNDLVEKTRGQQSAVRQPQYNQVLTQEGGLVAIARPETSEDKPSAPQPAVGMDAQDAAAMTLKLEAEIAEKTRTYSQRPRVMRIGASAKEYRFAQYIESWRAKAERIGELNYPAAARGKMYGSLLMSVTIKKDGSVKEIVIKRSSKYPVLDEAAVKIVHLGDPYAPFPPEITLDTDEIEITRTWTFTNNKLGVTAQ